jgi:quinol monooxygenase YgiN
MTLLHTAHLTVRPDVVEPFQARLRRHAETSVEAEPGCHRFDVHQERNDPALFFLIEVYDDEAALEAHRQSPHYKAFREDVADWVVDRKWWFWDHLAGA